MPTRLGDRHPAPGPVSAARRVTGACHVLLAHPDTERLATLTFHVAGAGFGITTAGTEAGVAAALARYPVDVLVLSAALANREVREVLGGTRKVHTPRDVAVLLLLAPGAPDAAGARIAALEHGADDCVGDDVSGRELVLRVTSIARRSTSPAPHRALQGTEDEVLRVGPVLLDRGAGDVTVGGSRVALTATEFALLALLLGRPGRLFTRAQLCAALWPAKHAHRARAIDAHIHRLRRKLGEAGAHIEALAGRGYRFRRTLVGANA